MRSGGSLGHLCAAPVAGDGIGIRVAAVTELESCRLAVLRDDGFGRGDGLSVFLVDFFNASIIHHFDTDTIVVRVSADRVVLSICFYFNRGNAGLALIRAVL